MIVKVAPEQVLDFAENTRILPRQLQEETRRFDRAGRQNDVAGLSRYPRAVRCMRRDALQVATAYKEICRCPI
jgi:hypothetical protein